MGLTSKIHSHLSEQTVRFMVLRNELYVLIILMGVGAIAVGLGADLIGIGGAGGVGPKQLILACIGGAILVVGIALDLTLGNQYSSRWRAQSIPNIQSLGSFLGIVIQLGLLMLVIRQYQLENQAFFLTIMPLTFYGFLVHYFLPLRMRLPFFLLLSITGIFAVLGFLNGVWLLGIGLLLIGICHLPISFPARVVTLLIAGTLLAVLRVNWLHATWLTAIWPILGSMFMFRLIIYLYDLRHDKGPVNISRTLSYFFLLPNVVFPFFPVVDYKTFQRTYYDDEHHRIYQRGVQWILRGITHLLLYRYVNYYLILAPESVVSTSDLIQFLVSNYLLYLRISGQFHLIVGMLQLFGFNLPETHHRYYLASSFNDFWRRINIYWKDFMMKVFYYPAYFRLRKWGTTTALVLSTLFVFLVTWLFHSYQWFWLRGSFPLLLTDFLFWAVLALLVVANSLYEAKYGRKRSLGRTSWTFWSFVSVALRTLGTFSVICILWSLWTSTSLSEWTSLLSVITVSSDDTGWLMAAIIITPLVFIGVLLIAKVMRWLSERISQWPVLTKSPMMAASLIVLIYVIGNPSAFLKIEGDGQELIRNLRMPRLSKRDAALLKRGYYEDLIDVNRFNTQLWEIYAKRPEGWEHFTETEAARRTTDFQQFELVPSSRIVFHGAPYTVNRWGMRDQDYELIPPPNTCRIALLGASQVNGWGVADNEVFETILEDLLNRENKAGTEIRYEFLNFAIGGHEPPQRLTVFESKVLHFKPDAVFYVAHPEDLEGSVFNIAVSVTKQIQIPHGYLNQIVQQSGINAKMTRLEAQRRLEPFDEKILAWVYSQIVDNCRQRNIRAFYILLPTDPRASHSKEHTRKLVRLAREAGFDVINLLDVYKKQDPQSLMVAEWDFHANAKAHKLIAQALYQSLHEHQDSILYFNNSTRSVTH
jgi:hypothetical protein